MKQIKLDDFMNFTFLSDVKAVGNTDKTLFLTHRCDAEKNRYMTDLWFYDDKTKKKKQLAALGNIASFCADEDQGVVFSAYYDETSCTVFYSLSWEDEGPEELFKVPLKAKLIGKLTDKIYLLSARQNLEILELTEGKTEEDKTETIKNYKEGQSRYRIYDEYPFWSNGEGVINKTRLSLLLFDAENQKLIQITDKLMDVSSVAISRELGKIAYFGSEYKALGHFYKGIYVYTYETGETKCIVKPDIYRMRQLDFFGSSIVFAASDMKRYGYSQCQDILTVDAEGGRVQTLHAKELCVGNNIGSDCRYGSGQCFKVYGDKLYLIVTEGEHSNIISIDKKGSIQTETDIAGSVDFFDINNGKIIYAAMRDMRLQELYSYDIINGMSEMITCFNEGFYNNKAVIKPERLWFANKSGTEIHGLILKPEGFDPGKKYPAVLDIHGGPKTAYGEVYYHEMQLLANMGFFVFFCNPRGSDGRGDEFAHLRGKFGDIDYSDIMEFTDEVLNKYPQIDKNRLAVIGGSYGGFMVNWIIGHTDRFAAAVSQRSISNFMTHECVSDFSIESTRGHILADVKDDYMTLWDKSPLKYAHLAKTPTLFIHSDEDYRCHHVEALQMFTALKYHGVDSRLCLFKGENHELSRSGKPRSRVKRLTEMVCWISKYLNN